MKASRYNVSVHDPDSGKTLIYNTLYGSLSRWESSEFEIAKRILADPCSAYLQDASVLDVLISQQNLVEDAADELAIVRSRKIMGSRDRNRLDVILMPTLDCNFACTYCYEPHHPSKMEAAEEAAIRAWLEREIPKHKVTMLHWFGGEPLLAYDQVLSISRHVTTVARESGVASLINITTNGYLLTSSRIRELIGIGIFNYQITVDGPPETHNKLRSLRNGRGSFDRLFANVVELARAHDDVRISVRVNFNHFNLHSIPRLLEMFPTDVRGRLRVVYEPIFGDHAVSAADNLTAEDIASSMAEYYELARSLGYDVALGMSGVATGKLVYCYAERESQYIIDFKGDVFKCSVSNFDPERRVGNIESDGSFVRAEAEWHRWVNAEVFEEQCISCAYLPLCMGGCPKTRFQKQAEGSGCALIPANASYLLKRLALGKFGDALLDTV